MPKIFASVGKMWNLIAMIVPYFGMNSTFLLIGPIHLSDQGFFPPVRARGGGSMDWTFPVEKIPQKSFQNGGQMIEFHFASFWIRRKFEKPLSRRNFQWNLRWTSLCRRFFIRPLAVDVKCRPSYSIAETNWLWITQPRGYQEPRTKLLFSNLNFTFCSPF